MKIVIQCAARKDPAAASFAAPDGRQVFFVAHPGLAPPSLSCVYARPDDLSDDGRTWRARLLAYGSADANPLNLLPGYRLYAHDAYRALVRKFGMSQVFILSAGWGLIPADLLMPNYDITFSASAEPWKRRRQNERYEDFCTMPDDGGEILFLGGKDYLRLFCRLTTEFTGGKTVLYNSIHCPALPPGFRAVRFETATRTNWHYEGAAALVAGEIGL